MSNLDLLLERNPDITSIDWQALLDLLHGAFAYMKPRIDPPSSLYRLSADDLRQKARTETLILARRENRIVGCAFCRDEGAWLYVGKIAVSENFQGQGIGKALIENSKKIVKQNGMMGLELETRVELTENQAAFSKMGFVQVGTSSHAGFDQATSVRMRLEL